MIMGFFFCGFPGDNAVRSFSRLGNYVRLYSSLKPYTVRRTKRRIIVMAAPQFSSLVKFETMPIPRKFESQRSKGSALQNRPFIWIQENSWHSCFQKSRRHSAVFRIFEYSFASLLFFLSKIDIYLPLLSLDCPPHIHRILVTQSFVWEN